MSFTFKDLCRCGDDEFLQLHRRTDAAARLGRTYELPCRLPSVFFPQDILLGFWKNGGQYTVYTRPPVVCHSASSPLAALLVPPQLMFPTFAALTTYLRSISPD